MGKWPDHLTEVVVDYQIKKGPNELLNCIAKLLNRSPLHKNPK